MHQNNEIIQKLNPTLFYLLYDSTVDSFIPKETVFPVLEPASLQNFNTDYQDDFSNRDLASVVFPVQQYVIFYIKKYNKQQEEQAKFDELSIKNKLELAKEHFICFGQYINSVKELISKIPSKSKSNKNINLRVEQNDDFRTFKNRQTLKRKSKKIFFQDDENKDSQSEIIECRFTFELDQSFIPLQGYYISYKWLWCNGPQMYEKIQSINKRAKQYGLTIIQVPYQIESDEQKSFNTSFTLCKSKPEIVNYIFTRDYVWQFLNFYIIDRYSTDRLFIHSTGIAFIKVDKNKDYSIIWRENTTIADNTEETLKENIFKKTCATIIALEIVYETIQKTNDLISTFVKDFEEQMEVSKKSCDDSKTEYSESKIPDLKSRSKIFLNRLKSRDDIIQINSKTLSKRYQKSGSNDYGAN